ncbi:MAG: winged helix-turn-helix domain-containing protein, partial [Cyanobacteriota bacterium]
VAYQLEAIHDALRSEISSEKGSEIGSEKVSAKAPSLDELILQDLSSDPNLSARLLAERLGLSKRAVEKHLAALQQKGRLLRHGSPRTGCWQVL